MKRRTGLVVAALLAACAFVMLPDWQREVAPTPRSADAPTVTSPLVQTRGLNDHPAAGAAEMPQALAGEPAVIDQSASAILSMTDARERGDDRAPPLVRMDAQWRDPPSQSELADPDQYQRYAERQQAKLYRAYVAAADQMLPQLDADIARAKAEGLVTAAQIAQAEEKRRRIAEMQAAISIKAGEP
ncbi:hypothetical protein GCM10007907_23020 [Chitinimonas prasina]|uniref:Lipase chaperone n=1 Tax=Chitinimonas prasina TaxID=1434937 RepID=A0ABQ5YIL5_9NEIS|nr:hypothetical protein [Chitinimonas prasina]GLR13512.1 hypothetical protein GCM10007907_23020 [Chitinimonas prasina]